MPVVMQHLFDSLSGMMIFRRHVALPLLIIVFAVVVKTNNINKTATYKRDACAIVGLPALGFAFPLLTLIILLSQCF